MDERRIYELAYREMTRIWFEAERCHKIANTELSYKIVHKAFDELKALEEMTKEKFGK
jgi:hypothetical protein